MHCTVSIDNRLAGESDPTEDESKFKRKEAEKMPEDAHLGAGNEEEGVGKVTDPDNVHDKVDRQVLAPETVLCANFLVKRREGAGHCLELTPKGDISP